MNVCVLMGSPRKSGNTAALLDPFLEELGRGGAASEVVWLCDLNIRACNACRACQRDWSVFGCAQGDDGQNVFDAVMACDLLMLATPIYSWYCTPPLKAALDRLVYGMNKYYGEQKGPSLWAGKRMAGLFTCGYRTEKGADLFEEGMARYCKHSQLVWLGALSERDVGYRARFMDQDKEGRARAWARQLLTAVQG